MVKLIELINNEHSILKILFVKYFNEPTPI